MASKTLGRVTCPIGCGHTAAQVKIKTDKGEDKTAYPYVHCAGCGIQLHTRSDEQARHLLAGTRPDKIAQEAPQAPQITKPEPTPAPDDKAPPAPAKTPSFLNLWGAP